jgi:hypothetical protein
MPRAPTTSRAWVGAPAFVMATTAVVFVAVAFVLTLRLRADLREQILRREAQALRSMVELQQIRAEDELARFGLGDEPADWFPLLLETSRLNSVAALRLFDATGALRDALPMPGFAQVPVSDWKRLEAGDSFARLHRRASLASLRIGEVETAATGGVPLLEVLVPLRVPGRQAFAGVAQYWIDGAAMQREFRTLDRHLWLRSGVAAVVGAAIVLGALAWAFRRLHAANHEL